MPQTNLSIKIDENDKKNFEIFCNETGMNTAVAISMFIKTVLREHKLPFEIKVDPFYIESNKKYLERLITSINNGKIKLEENEVIDEDDE